MDIFVNNNLSDFFLSFLSMLRLGSLTFTALKNYEVIPHITLLPW